MKEYFTKTIYEEPNLIIGTNGTSLIFGQNKNWIVMDKGQLVRIEKHFSSGSGQIDLTGITANKVKDNIQLSQYDDLISVKKDLLTQKLLK